MYDKSRRTKEKKIKNEREKAQAKIQAMNIGVKIRGLILKEDKAKRGAKERIIKAYKKIFNRDVVRTPLTPSVLEMNFSKNIMKKKR